jgi:hypothetical protein
VVQALRLKGSAAKAPPKTGSPVSAASNAATAGADPATTPLTPSVATTRLPNTPVSRLRVRRASAMAAGSSSRVKR